jgi:hypothetical protein
MYWYQEGYCIKHQKEMHHNLLNDEFICEDCKKDKLNV